MAGVDSNEKQLLDGTSIDHLARSKQIFFIRAINMYGGIFFLGFSGLILLGVYSYVLKKPVNDFHVYELIGLCLAFLTSLASLIMGVRLMIRDSLSERVVIPKDDRQLLEELIRAGNEKGIDQYVRLSSLSGTTGTATKLGLTGLPLATVGLTLFFSMVAIFGITGFLDLAKLTLGAFIGSFVQRNIVGDKSGSDAIRIYNVPNSDILPGKTENDK